MFRQHSIGRYSIPQPSTLSPHVLLHPVLVHWSRIRLTIRYNLPYTVHIPFNSNIGSSFIIIFKERALHKKRKRRPANKQNFCNLFVSERSGSNKHIRTQRNNNVKFVDVFRDRSRKTSDGFYFFLEQQTSHTTIFFFLVLIAIKIENG